MTEQTTTAPAPIPASVGTPQGELAASDPAEKPQTPPPRVAGFGGRTDANAGMDLGLAPTSFPTTRQVADDSAPPSLGQPQDGDGGGVVSQTIYKAPPKKEHPFKKAMREAAAAAKAAETPEREVVDGELVEDAEIVDAEIAARA